MSDEDIDAIDLGEVDASHPVEVETQVEVGSVTFRFVALAFWRGQGFFIDVDLGLEGGIEHFDLDIAVLDLLLKEIIGLESLLEFEDVFGLVVALQGFGDLFFALAAAVVAMFSQFFGVVVTGDNAADDLHAGDTGDIGDDVGELEVHLLEGFLHVLNLAGAALNQVGPVADEGAQGADVFGGTEGGAEEAVGVKLLNPLAVEDVGLAAGDVLDVTRVDQVNLETLFFEDFVDGNPVDAGGLYGHGVDATGVEPVGQRM